MDVERWQRIKAIFHQALELPPSARDAFLAAACAGDAALGEHLRDLLAAHEDTSDRLEAAFQSALPALQEELQSAVEGLPIGPYRVIAELGRGGMGAVYLAARADGAFEQRVAVKLIKRGMDTEEIVRRFVHERQILAALVHPHIARLLDGGTTADGRPYFVMEAIDGQPITAYADAAGQGVEARLRLFLEVASAVQFAHQSLVVHRDLKPANILVGPDGAPKLLDFGIAKLLGQGAAGARTEWTALDSQPLTPDYASPEQLGGRAVTTATDVYGLGVLLYELLVGENPAAVERRLGAGWRLRPASQAARALAKAGAGSGRDDARARRSRRLEGDLDTILDRALAVDPARRYATVAELADDLERHLAHQPVKARRPTLAYRLSRAVLRHRLATAFVLALALASAAMTWQAVEQQRLRRRAAASAKFLAGLFEAADPAQNRGAALTAREILDTGARIAMEEKSAPSTLLFRELGDLSRDPETRAGLLQTIGDVQASLGLAGEAGRSLRQALALAGRGGWSGSRLAAATARTSLGHLALEASDYAHSRAFFDGALRERRRLLGSRAPEVAEDLNGLGLVALEQDDAQGADPLFREAWSIYREAGDAGRPGVAKTLNNLGALASDRGDFARAARHYGEALRIDRELLGADHPDSVKLLSNLAEVQFHLGDVGGAETSYREILRIRRHLLGPDHPDLALTWSSLGIVEERRGDLAAAEAAVREALAMRRRLFLTADAKYADALNSLAGIVRKRGDRVAARRIYQQSLKLYRELLGEEAPDVANVLAGLAVVELEQGELAAAEAGVRQSLAIRRKVYGPEHPNVARSLHLLARILGAAHRPAEAEAAFRQALDLRRRKLSPAHPDTAESLVGLGHLLVEQKRAAEAEPLLREGLAIERHALPAGHAAIGTSTGQLGICYQALGRREEARALLQESYSILALTGGRQHPETLEIREHLRALGVAPTAR